MLNKNLKKKYDSVFDSCAQFTLNTVVMLKKGEEELIKKTGKEYTISNEGLNILSNMVTLATASMSCCFSFIRKGLAGENVPDQDIELYFKEKLFAFSQMLRLELGDLASELIAGLTTKSSAPNSFKDNSNKEEERDVYINVRSMEVGEV